MLKSKTARSTAAVMSLTTLSRLLGFARQAAVNAVFGATGNADVLNAVFLIPNNLRKLMAEGALSSAFIPVLSQTHADAELRESGTPRNIVRRLLGLQYVVLVPVLLLSVVFAEPILDVILGFDDPERQTLAIGLFRWFIHYALLISVSAVLMGSLNSVNRFSVPAFTPILFSLSVITALVFLSNSLGVYAMVIGVLAGGAAQILFQWPQFRRNGFSFVPRFDFSDPHFKRIIRRWLPVLAASSIFAVNQMIAIRFATGLSDGSASAIANAIIFWQLPQGIFAISVTTVLFPQMSRLAGSGERDDLRDTVVRGLRSISALLIPSAILLAMFGPEVVAMAFQRGAFRAPDTIRTAYVLTYYCIGMVSVSCYTFLQRFFYALGDYRSPAYTAAAILVSNTVLSLWLKETTLGVAGLALANSIAFTAGSLYLMILARARLNGLNGRDIVTTVWKALVSASGGATVILVSKVVWGAWWMAGSSWHGWLRLLGTGTVSVAVTGGLLLVLGVDAASDVARRLRRGKE